MPSAERVFRAMGSDCHIRVVTSSVEAGDPAAAAEELAQLAVDRVELLEQCWSRFRPASELNRLNRAAGQGAMAVSADLLTLVAHMARAWTLSDGRFDPTVLSSMNALGYDEDFAAVSARSSAPGDAVLGPAPGMAGVALDGHALTIELPRGVGIDPGAIGKGLGADIITAELTSAGALGVLVNLGGDLAIAGADDDGSPWRIGVEDERRPATDADRLLRLVEFPVGTEAAGVATSTTLKRRWAQGRRHHVIDPRSGSMAVSDLVQVTVIATEAWEAEVTATTALLMTAAEAEAWLRGRGTDAILVTTDRVIVTMDEEI